MALLEALGTVGDWMNKPGAWTRGLLAGRPGEEVSGRDLLEQWGLASPNQEGLDWGDVGGFVADIATDPLTWIPGAVLGKAVAKGISPLAKALGGTDEAALVARRMATSGLPSTQASATGSGLASGSRFRPLAERFSQYKNVEMLDDAATDQLARMAEAGERLPYPMTGALVEKGSSPTRGFTADLVRLGTEAESTAPIARALKRGLREEDLAQGPSALKGLYGFYEPRTGVQASFRQPIIAKAALHPENARLQELAKLAQDELYRTGRHERLHGLVNQAALTGEYDALPWVQRLAARLQAPETQRVAKLLEQGLDEADIPLEGGFKYALGRILDETGAYALENKGLMNQLRGGASFLFPRPRAMMNPQSAWNDYLNTFRTLSPGAGALYRAIAASPYAAGALGAAGGLGAGAYGLSQAFGE